MLIKCLWPQSLSRQWWTARDQKSRPLMTWSSGVQCQIRSYRITLLDVSGYLPTSQTTFITINISVVSSMQNTFGTTQLEFWWCHFNAMNRQAVHMVCCTRSTRRRKQKPPRNDTVIRWTGMSPDSHCKSTAIGMPPHLNCLFIIEEAYFTVKGLLALVQMCATGPICQTTGMPIVEERNQPLMQCLHDGSYGRTRHVRVRTTDIAPISAIQGALHLILLTLQPESTWWYLCNIVELNALNLCYMKIIWFDA